MKNNKTARRHTLAIRFGLLAGICVAATALTPASDANAASRFFDLFDRAQTKAKPKVSRTYRQEPSQTASKAETPWVKDFPNLDKDEPLQMVVNLSKQQITVYKGGIKVATSKVSSGKPGHTTPSGVFSIIQKNRQHFSNLYGGAPMPFMQRLTWGGVALHAGYVPNYPASHGCIRLPRAFAQQLFSATEMGAHVLVTTEEPQVTEIKHKKLFQPAVLATVFDPKYLTANTNVVRDVDDATTDPHEADADPVFQGTHLRQVSTTEPDAEDGGDEDATVDVASEMLHVYEGRDQRPLRIIVSRRTEKGSTVEVQRMLNKLGYDIGQPDGRVGRKTREAIVAFQKEKGLKVTGAVSQDLWRRLNAATGTWRFSNAHLYVRQGQKSLFDAPITINHKDEPLGTHVYTAMHFNVDATQTRWTAVTLKQARMPRRSEFVKDEETLAKSNAVTAEEALDRIEIPDRLRRQIEALLTPGSSMIISDNGYDPRETQPWGTDFIVRTW